MNHLKKTVLAAILFVFSSFQTALATTLQVNSGGQLTGALNVNVEGVLYDVEFKQGSFRSIFGYWIGLDAHTQLEADAFSNALMASVFIGQYDTNHSLTIGCGNWYQCWVSTPFSADNTIDLSVAVNDPLEANDGVTYGQTDAYNDLSLYADWSLTPSQVPIPAASWLFGSGLLGIIGVAGKKSA